MLSAKEHSQRMSQEFAHPARCQMPKIARPNPFDVETLHQLANLRFNPITNMRQAARPGKRLSFGRFLRSQQSQTFVSQALE